MADRYDISCLNALYLAGERADPDTIEWAKDLLGVPVVDHWWQTETGWAIAANPLGIEELPIKLGSPVNRNGCIWAYAVCVIHGTLDSCRFGICLAQKILRLESIQVHIDFFRSLSGYVVQNRVPTARILNRSVARSGDVSDNLRTVRTTRTI